MHRYENKCSGTQYLYYALLQNALNIHFAPAGQYYIYIIIPYQAYFVNSLNKKLQKKSLKFSHIMQYIVKIFVKIINICMAYIT